MASVVYNKFKQLVMGGSINLSADDINVALVTSAYTPDIDSDVYFSDVTNEVSGTGYTAGGKTLSGAALTVDNTDNEGVFDADDLTWDSSTITAFGAVVYKDTGVASTSPLIMYFDFTENKSSSSGDFTIQWNSEGLLNAN